MARPLVTLAYAQSLDGSLALRRGEPLALSGPESMLMTHQLRAEHDAILVGIGTVLADNPQLTVRLVPGESPQPVILDSALRTPPSARLMAGAPWIVTAGNKDNTGGRRAQLSAAGATILDAESDRDGRVALSHMLELLGEHGIGRLMVEGGATVLTAFLRSRLADRVVVTIAPRYVGGVAAVFGLAANIPLNDVDVQRAGADIVVSGSIRR